MEKFYYSYEEFKKDTQKLVNSCREYEPDILLAVARGGLTLSHLMAQAMDMRNLYALNSIHYEGELKLDTFNIFNIPDVSHAKRVLVVDDIVDSGETMEEILKVLKEKFPNVEFKLATIFYKKSAVLQPDYTVREAKEWIDFFWEVDVI
ncbi:putative nucleotide phosphoribosyltransferase [Malaciobacter marinus]|uniref:Nicotinate phosphoribosyltransferase n=1 Tax=Malaciobacter marinus TaxID=505249 RepID=A0A347TLW9_9BACT|nr:MULTISPECIES: phosphoribosyltransferase family protein [Malaciobacter]AXX87597.1 putative nucleotide phosphoribosyltransferase [Malaciobacter marinus]PHO14299.1 nicotinate phosphoribosyltransferase [Malaciobacter marinus]RYA24854.1 nicotinate phosphoribosyltransferase [Malaciobacter halophilus]